MAGPLSKDELLTEAVLEETRDLDRRSTRQVLEAIHGQDVHAVAAVVSGSPHRILITSFDAELLREARRVSPGLARGQLLHGGLRHDPKVEPSALLPDHALLEPHWVADTQQAGLAVLTWTVNHPADITRALSTGVDGVITDHPRRVPRQ